MSINLGEDESGCIEPNEDNVQMNFLPSQEELTIQFVHPAYRVAERFLSRNTGVRHFQTWTEEETRSRVGEANVLVISGLWRNDLLETAHDLRYIQAISAGYEQFPLDQLRTKAIRLANARGVNADAVSHHAMGLVLALARQLHLARDQQHNRHWRPMISDRALREDDLCGQTMLIIGLGEIGSRLAKLAKVFGMRVLGVKQDVASHDGTADEVYAPDQLQILLGRADFVVLCCPLNRSTREVVDANAFSAMKTSGQLVNVARGGCVDETALASALTTGEIAGAAIDHFHDEPLPMNSLFWSMENLIITPHSAGETRKYEDNVIDILIQNIDRLWAGNKELVNQIL
jgi:phosphoglycerate dehydrogenase-like enzyme